MSRMIDRDWTMEECLQVMEDLDHVAEFGCWKGPIPRWAVQCSKEMHTHALGAPVLMVAYEKCAKTFRKQLHREGQYIEVRLQVPEKGNKDSTPTKFPEGG